MDSMPTVLIETSPPPPPAPPRKKWTRTECQVLESSGLLQGQQLELVDGELINKMGKNRPHVASLMLLVFWAARAFGEQFVNSEAPLDVAPDDNPTNEPQPDLYVAKRPSTEYRSTPPAYDVRLIVEISDSSLVFDLTTKAALYARAGIPEYWVVDVSARRLIVHRDIRDGRYSSIVGYSENERVSPLAAPHAELRVGDVIA
jgi:Uma2 family endonuclease